LDNFKKRIWLEFLAISCLIPFYLYIVRILKEKFGDQGFSGYGLYGSGKVSHFGQIVMLKYQFYNILILIGLIFCYFIYLGNSKE